MNINEILLENAELEKRILCNLIENGTAVDENIVKTILLKIKELFMKLATKLKRYIYNAEKTRLKTAELEKELFEKFKPFKCRTILLPGDLKLEKIEEFMDVHNSTNSIINNLTKESKEEALANNTKVKQELETRTKEYKANNVIKDYEFNSYDELTEYSVYGVPYDLDSGSTFEQLKMLKDRVASLGSTDMVSGIMGHLTSDSNAKEIATINYKSCTDLAKIVSLCTRIHVDQSMHYIKLLKIALKEANK